MIKHMRSCREVSDAKADILIKGFHQRDLKLKDNEVATLIYKECDFEKAVLYIHGFADYIYNHEVGQKYVDEGYAFYGLDLRHYGRSVRDQEKKFYVDDIATYFEEIDLAIYNILAKHNKIILHGFSMGGLISSMYMKEGFYRNHISGLVLASPFLKFKVSKFEQYIVKPVVMLLAKFFPKFRVKFSTEKYKHLVEQLERTMGLDIDHEMFKEREIPLYFGWFKAMFDSLEKIDKGLDIHVPILVLSSNKSHNPNSQQEYNCDADAVLDVKDIKIQAPLLGEDVTVRQIKNAVHDIFVSPGEAKEDAYRYLKRWLKHKDL